MHGPLKVFKFNVNRNLKPFCYPNKKMSWWKKVLNLISEFGRTARYKVNIQKTKAFLYTNNKIPETETREKIPFTIAVRKIKY